MSPNMDRKFVNGYKRRRPAATPRRSAAEWEKRKHFVKINYVDLKLSPCEVIERLAKIGFEVSRKYSLPQFQHKLKDWGFRKKTILTQTERRRIAKDFSAGNLEGEAFIVLDGGVELKTKNARRTVKRHGHKDSLTADKPLVRDRNGSSYPPHSLASAAPGIPRASIDKSKQMADQLRDKTFAAKIDQFPAISNDLCDKLLNPRYIGRLCTPGFQNDIRGVLEPMKGAIDELVEPLSKGLEDPDVAMFNYFRLSSLQYHGFQKHEYAKRCCKEALIVKERILLRTLRKKRISSEKDKRGEIPILFNIGVTLNDLGRCGEALGWFKQTLDYARDLLGDEHQATLRALYNIATTLSKQERYAESITWYKIALNAHRKVIGANNECTLRIEVCIGSAFDHLDKYEDALQWYLHAQVNQKSALGAEHNLTVSTTNRIGMVLYKQRQYKEALRSFEEVLTVRKRTLGNDDRKTEDAHRNVILTRKHVRHVPEPEPAQIEARALYSQIYQSWPILCSESWPKLSRDTRSKPALATDQANRIVENIIDPKTNGRIYIID